MHAFKFAGENSLLICCCLPFECIILFSLNSIIDFLDVVFSLSVLMY